MRFSIRSLLILTGIVALFCGLFFVLPDGPAIFGLMLLGLLAPTSFVAGIIYARGHGRAFAIGGLIPCVWIIFFAAYFLPMMLISEPMMGWASDMGIESTTNFKIAFVTEFLLAVTSGGVAMAVRWLCLRSEHMAVKHSQLVREANSELISPRDKAELYKIMEGRMNPFGAENGDRFTSTIADPAFDNSPPRSDASR